MVSARKFFLLIFLILSPLHATKYAGEPLELGFGARALGMGGSFTALSDDPSAVYWNPAGLTSVPQYSFLLQHSEYFGGIIKVESGALALGNFISEDVKSGIGIYFLHSEGIEFTELKDTQDTTIPGNVRVKEKGNYRFMTIFLSGSKSYAFGDIGLTFKLLHEDLAVESGNGFGLDFGFKRKFGAFSFAFLIRDLTTTPLFWSSGKKEYIFPSISMGSGAHIGESFVFTGDIIFRFEGREETAQFALPGPVSMEYRFGTEVLLTNHFALRAGLDRGKPAFGAGVTYGKFSFDYAYLAHADLGDSHRVSIKGRI